MFIISILFFILLVSLFVVTSLIFLGCGRLFKAQNLSFKNAILTGAIILIVGITLEALFFIFPTESTLIEIAFLIISIVLAIWIVKIRFATSIFKAVGVYFTSLIFSVIFSAAFALSIRIYIIQAFKIPSSAMLNTIQIGDHILANKLIYKISEPKRGDIIIFPYPHDPSKDYIKRIIGLSGETVEIRDKNVIINGDVIQEPYAYYSNIEVRKLFGPVMIPEDSLFVMGDNRDNSLDSRHWGFVNKSTIRGKATGIYWSWDEANSQVRWERIGNTL